MKIEHWEVPYDLADLADLLKDIIWRELCTRIDVYCPPDTVTELRNAGIPEIKDGGVRVSESNASIECNIYPTS